MTDQSEAKPSRRFHREGAVLHLYVLGASHDPDKVTCCVPWEIDREEIYFGPCKKSLRLHLKRSELRDKDEVVPERDIYVVGLNALPSPDGPRKVVWAGRINRLMTFARASEVMAGERYRKMLETKFSPLHVLPLRNAAGALRGYEFRPNGDHPDDWPRDLTTTKRDTIKQENQLHLRDGVAPHVGFSRDVCFTTDNLFFARGKGLQVDQEAVAVLQAAQPKVAGIDEVAVFGRHNGVPDGFRGRYLTLSEPDLVERFLGWLHNRAAVARQ